MKFHIINRILAFFFLIGTYASAEAEWQSLIVELRDQDPVVLNLSDMLSVSVEQDSYIISDEGTHLEFPRYDVLAFHHSSRSFNITTGVETIQNTSDKRSISISGNKVLMKGFKVGTTVFIYDHKGTTLKASTYCEDLEIDLFQLPEGMLILKIGDMSCKIRNKRS